MDYLVTKFLGKYLEHFLLGYSGNETKFDLKFFKGESVIEKIELNPLPFEYYLTSALPFLRITNGFVYGLSMKVPFTSIKSQAMVISIDKLELEIGEPVKFDTQKMDSFEPIDTSDIASEERGDRKRHNFIDKIIDGIEIKIKHVCVHQRTLGQFKTESVGAWTPPELIFDLRDVHIVTTDEYWKEVSMNDTREFSRTDKDFVWNFRVLSMNMSLSIKSQHEKEEKAVMLLKDVPITANIMQKRRSLAEILAIQLSLNASLCQIELNVKTLGMLLSCLRGFYYLASRPDIPEPKRKPDVPTNAVLNQCDIILNVLLSRVVVKIEEENLGAIEFGASNVSVSIIKPIEKPSNETIIQLKLGTFTISNALTSKDNKLVYMTLNDPRTAGDNPIELSLPFLEEKSHPLEPEQDLSPVFLLLAKLIRPDPATPLKPLFELATRAGFVVVNVERDIVETALTIFSRALQGISLKGEKSEPPSEGVYTPKALPSTASPAPEQDKDTEDDGIDRAPALDLSVKGVFANLTSPDKDKPSPTVSFVMRELCIKNVGDIKPASFPDTIKKTQLVNDSDYYATYGAKGLPSKTPQDTRQYLATVESVGVELLPTPKSVRAMPLLFVKGINGYYQHFVEEPEDKNVPCSFASVIIDDIVQTNQAEYYSVLFDFVDQHLYRPLPQNVLDTILEKLPFIKRVLTSGKRKDDKKQTKEEKRDRYFILCSVKRIHQCLLHKEEGKELKLADITVSGCHAIIEGHEMSNGSGLLLGCIEDYQLHLRDKEEHSLVSVHRLGDLEDKMFFQLRCDMLQNKQGANAKVDGAMRKLNILVDLRHIYSLHGWAKNYGSGQVGMLMKLKNSAMVNQLSEFGGKLTDEQDHKHIITLLKDIAFGGSPSTGTIQLLGLSIGGRDDDGEVIKPFSVEKIQVNRTTEEETCL